MQFANTKCKWSAWKHREHKCNSKCKIEEKHPGEKPKYQIFLKTPKILCTCPFFRSYTHIINSSGVNPFFMEVFRDFNAF